MNTAFDVTGCRRSVSSVHVAKVPLLFYKYSLVCKNNQGTANRSVSVRVVLHALTNNICNLLEAAVVHLKEGVHYAPLNRFKTVLKIWDCPVAYNITRIFNKILVE